MAERAAAYNARFSTNKMSKAILRRLYKECKVTRTKIQKTKPIKDAANDGRVGELRQRGIKLAKNITEGYEILYLDEIMFTKNTYLERTWARVNKPLEVDLEHFYHEAIAVCVAVSA